MRPYDTFQYDELWLAQHKQHILPDPNIDEGFHQFLNSDFEDIDCYLQIASGIKVNGINQSFIAIVNEKYPEAIAHCEYYISPVVNNFYCQLFQQNEANKLILVGLGYFLSEWFSIDELRDMHLLGYWALAPGSLYFSAKRKRDFEEGKFDAYLNQYIHRHHLSKQQFKYFIAKLKMNGVSQYLNYLTPHSYLEYQHVIDVFVHYLYKNTTRAEQLSMLYFPHHVINDVLKD